MPELVSKTTMKTPMVTKAEAEAPAKGEIPLGCQLMGAAKLRKEGKTGKGIKVAVIDSGVDAEHPGFNGMVKYQLWFRGGTPLEEDDHGTHVAGTIHNMAPDAELHDYRVFGAEGGIETDQAVGLAIIEAVYDGCHVINMSLGARLPSFDCRTAIQYANKRGVIVVCAAGNEGDGKIMTNERAFPAMWEECISVGAVFKAEGLPVAAFSNTNPELDYAGIGVYVNSMKPGGGYQEMSGTSMACPHVAGLIAALLPDVLEKSGRFFNRNKSKDEILRMMLDKNNVMDVAIKGNDDATGVGFLTYLNKKEFDAVMLKVKESDEAAAAAAAAEEAKEEGDAPAAEE